MEGYQLFAGYVNDEPIAVAGVTISTNFYLGRHAYVYDLVVDENNRSKGYGAELLEYVHNWAADNDCVAVELESGLWREDAHRFYLDLDYEKYCYSTRPAICGDEHRWLKVRIEPGGAASAGGTVTVMSARFYRGIGFDQGS